MNKRTNETVVAFIQARMGSSRFPGKVLAPFRGRPIIDHVLKAVCSTQKVDDVVVVTSEEACEEPLISYLTTLGVNHVRGPLNNVFERFQLGVRRYPCDWILRICADSPLLDTQALEQLVDHGLKTACDLVTTRCSGTFPKGQNADLFRAATFMSIDPADLCLDHQEHVVTHFLDDQDRYKVCGISARDANLAELDLAVDTPEDLRRLDALDAAETRALFGSAP